MLALTDGLILCGLYGKSTAGSVQYLQLVPSVCSWFKHVTPDPAQLQYPKHAKSLLVCIERKQSEHQAAARHDCK